MPEEDLDVIDFIFATFASNRMPGDPLWGLIVDASGGGKTEPLRSLRDKPNAFFLSKLTDKTLKSGYRDPKNPSKDPSLLPKLNGQVLIIKDLSPLLSMQRNARNTIVSDLRDAYDGFTDDGYGNVGRVSYKSRFTLLAASTLAIERFASVDQELGERFVKFRARGVDNRSKVRQAVENVGQDDDLRSKIDEAVKNFLGSLPRKFPREISPQLREAISIVADFTATARSYVPRNRNHELSYIPRPEVGTRLGKELSKLLLALAYVRGKTVPDAEDLATVCRVAEDCLPPNRLEVLLAISGRRSSLPDKTARDTIDDLTILGILKSKTELANSWAESLRDIRKLFRTPPLRECATLGVSGFFREAEQGQRRPPNTAHLKLTGASLIPDDFA
jgi:hypothetical protein